MKVGRKFIAIMPLLIIITILTGCAGMTSPGGDESTGLPGSKGELVTPSPGQDGGTRDTTPDQDENLPVETLPPGLEVVETPEGENIVGEVPEELFQKIIADLIVRTDSDRDSVVVLKAQSVFWNDGALGCPQPGEFYTQSLIEGYQVILKIGDEEFDYHASETGYFFLCETRG